VRVRVKIPFTVTSTSATNQSFVILKQPSSSDVYSAFTRVVGEEPVTLPGENIYPVVTTPPVDSNGDGNTVVASLEDDAIVMSAYPDDMDGVPKVGDRILGNDALAEKIFVVGGVNNEARRIAISYGGESLMANELVDPGDVLSFSNQVNYSWPLDDTNKITPGMLVTHSSGDGAIVADTVIGDYKDTLTILSGTENKKVITKNYASAIDYKGVKPTMVKGLVTNQTGSVVFNNQQQKLLAGDTINIAGYGEKYIADIDGYTVRFTDLAIALTKITTYTTSAVDNNVNVPVAAGAGIRNTVSTVTGIGINPALVAPTVSDDTIPDDGEATIVLSAAQTLENGITLTFPGAGKVATITGNIEILKAGPSDATLYFDLEQLLTSA
jgi:hypothetical protein